MVYREDFSDDIDNDVSTKHLVEASGDDVTELASRCEQQEELRARVEHQSDGVEQLVRPGREDEPPVGRDQSAFPRRDHVVHGSH